MDGGQRFCYRGSWTATGEQTSWECAWRILGDKGAVTWDGHDGFHAQRQRHESATGKGSPLIRDLEDIEVPGIDADSYRRGHDGIIHDFLQCLIHGRQPGTICTDNIHSLAMVLGAIESADKDSQRVSIHS